MRKLKQYSLLVRYKGHEEELVGDVSRVLHVPEPGYLYVDYDEPSRGGLLFKDLRDYAVQRVRELYEEALDSLREWESRYREWCTPTPEDERERSYCEHIAENIIPSARAEVEKWRLILDGLERGEAELVLVED